MLKRHAIQNQIKTLVVNDEVVKEQTEINKTHIPLINPLNVNPEKWSNTLKQIVGNLATICLSVFDHFMNLALKGLKAVTKVLQYLQDKNLPKLNDGQCPLFEKDITEEKVKHELNKLEINKSPGNDGLTKEFYEAFWDHIKVPLLLSFKMAFLKKELSTSQ